MRYLLSKYFLETIRVRYRIAYPWSWPWWIRMRRDPPQGFRSVRVERRSWMESWSSHWLKELFCLPGAMKCAEWKRGGDKGVFGWASPSFSRWWVACLVFVRVPETRDPAGSERSIYLDREMTRFNICALVLLSGFDSSSLFKHRLRGHNW